MEALGIEPKLLLAQVVNFGIIVIVLNILLYKPITAMLEKRKKQIEEGLSYTEKMKKEYEKAEEKKENVLSDARKEGQVMIEEARKNAKDEEKQILEEARKQADDLVKKARIAIEEERMDMQKNIKKDTVQLAISIAKRLLSESLSVESQHAILAKQMKRIDRI